MQSSAAQLSIPYMYGPCCCNAECCGILQFVLLVLPRCDLRLSHCDMRFQAPPSDDVHL
jgi:hypothetical protein